MLKILKRSKHGCLVMLCAIGMVTALTAQVPQTTTYTEGPGQHTRFATQNANATVEWAITNGMSRHQLTFVTAPSVTALTVTVTCSTNGSSFSSVGSSSTFAGATITWTGSYNVCRMALTAYAGSGTVNADYYGVSNVAANVSGTGTAEQIAYWTGSGVSSTLGGDSGLTRDITDATNRYGLNIADVTGATNNWNLWSGPTLSDPYTFTPVSKNVLGAADYSVALTVTNEATSNSSIETFAPTFFTLGSGNFTGDKIIIDAEMDHGSSGTMQSAILYYGFFDNNGGTVTDFKGIKLDAVATAGGHVITNAIGIDIGNMTGATLSRSIRTGTGLAEFGDDLLIDSQNELRLGDSDNSNYVGFKSGATVGSNVIWTLPTADSSGCFSSNGSGTVTLVSCAISTGTTSAQGAGTAYSLTNTAAAIDFGTTDPAITLGTAGTYLISGQVQVTYTGATVVAETATLKVRRTNNTAADLSSVVVLDLPIATTLTNTYGIFQIPPFVYTTAATNDAITIFANVSAGLGAGTIDATAVGTSIIAQRLY